MNSQLVSTTVLISAGPAKHSIPECNVRKAVDACRAASTVESINLRVVLRELMYPDYTQAEYMLRRWPTSARERIDKACQAALTEWIDSEEGRRLTTLPDEQTLAVLVEVAVQSVACQVDKAYRSVQDWRVGPVAVLVDAYLNQVRSERAPVNGMWDIIATWPDVSVRVPWDGDASADEVASLLLAERENAVSKSPDIFEVAERTRAQQREHAIEQGLDPDLCPCGNPGVCVGQFEGDVRPKLGCAECCNHEDFGECGRCWPLVREAGS